MSFDKGDWVLGCSCARCGRLCVVASDQGRGKGPIKSPVTGGFYCRCTQCGACNAVQSGDLKRFRVEAQRAAHTIADPRST